MAEKPNIMIQIDEEALRAQVHRVIESVMRDVAMRFRWAADILDPEFQKEQGSWMEIEVQRRVEAALGKESDHA